MRYIHPCTLYVGFMVSVEANWGVEELGLGLGLGNRLIELNNFAKISGFKFKLDSIFSVK